MTEGETKRAVAPVPIETTGFVESSAEGPQTFAIAPGDQIKLATAAHKQRQETVRLDHELAERQKDNDARRAREAREEVDRRKRDNVIYWLIVVAIVVGIVVGGAAGFLSQNDATPRWGQSLVTLIVGGLVGYVTGSRAGR